MDIVTGLWALWILFLFYMTVTAKSLLLKTLTVLVMALSVHDAWRYIRTKTNINDPNEIEEEASQDVENKRKETSKKDHQ